MGEMTLDDAIFEFELMASDKCNGNRQEHYKQIAEWLQELKDLKSMGETSERRIKW